MTTEIHLLVSVPPVLLFLIGGKGPAPVGLCNVMSSGKFWFGNNLPSCPGRGLLKAREKTNEN